MRTAADLSTPPGVARLWKPETADGKWTPSLMSPTALAAYIAVESAGDFTTLQSGARRPSAWSPATTDTSRCHQPRQGVGLRSSELLALSPPGSRHLRGLTFTASAYDALGKADPPHCFPARGQPSAAASAYIEAGERLKVDDAYKCRVRSPWWRVPLVKPADLLLTYMNADTPRLCTNRARPSPQLGARRVPAARAASAWHGSPAACVAELHDPPRGGDGGPCLRWRDAQAGAEGGGPLPVPDPPRSSRPRPALAAIRPQVAARLRQPVGCSKRRSW